MMRFLWRISGGALEARPDFISCVHSKAPGESQWARGRHRVTQKQRSSFFLRCSLTMARKCIGNTFESAKLQLRMLSRLQITQLISRRSLADHLCEYSSKRCLVPLSARVYWQTKHKTNGVELNVQYVASASLMLTYNETPAISMYNTWRCCPSFGN